MIPDHHHECAEDFLEATIHNYRVIVTETIQSNLRHDILFRRFNPITIYEPDPKREEWRSLNDCRACPHFGRAGTVVLHLMSFRSQLWDCLIRPKDKLECLIPLGDPSFCRFGEYRRTLFRRFEL